MIIARSITFWTVNTGWSQTEQDKPVRQRQPPSEVPGWMDARCDAVLDIKRVDPLLDQMYQETSSAGRSIRHLNVAVKALPSIMSK